MSRSKTELVSAGFRAFERRDMAAIEELCHPDVEFDWSRRLLDPIVTHGYQGIREFFEEVDSLFEEIAFEEDEIAEFGDDVLVVSTGRFKGRTSGAEVTASGAIVWSIRDGKLARFRFYQSKEEALEGMREPAGEAP